MVWFVCGFVDFEFVVMVLESCVGFCGDYVGLPD